MIGLVCLKSKVEAAKRALQDAGKLEDDANKKLHGAKQEQVEAVARRVAAAALLAETTSLQAALKRQRTGGGVGGVAMGRPSTHHQPEQPTPALHSHVSNEVAASTVASSSEGEAEEEASSRPSTPHWLSWNDPQKWKSREIMSQRRRNVKIDAAMNEDHSTPPRGDHTRGWRFHWRRGLVGCVQDWACGRRFRVVHMLAELASYFGVQEEVIHFHAHAHRSTLSHSRTCVLRLHLKWASHSQRRRFRS